MGSSSIWLEKSILTLSSHWRNSCSFTAPASSFLPQEGSPCGHLSSTVGFEALPWAAWTSVPITSWVSLCCSFPVPAPNHSCPCQCLLTAFPQPPRSCSGSSLHACVLSRFSRVQLCKTQWTVAHQAPLSMGFSRQEYWSGLPCPPPGDLSDPGIEPSSLALQADS